MDVNETKEITDIIEGSDIELHGRVVDFVTVSTSDTSGTVGNSTEVSHIVVNAKEGLDKLKDALAENGEVVVSDIDLATTLMISLVFLSLTTGVYRKNLELFIMILTTWVSFELYRHGLQPMGYLLISVVSSITVGYTIISSSSFNSKIKDMFKNKKVTR